MRAVVIFAGVSLGSHFHSLLYLFGALLIASEVKMLVVKSKPTDFNKSRLIRGCRRIFRVSELSTSENFFVRTTEGWAVTPLFQMLLFVELSKLIFAIDSIPAIMAIRLDPFLVHTSNAFAVLGLRSLYFALAGLIPKFEFLHHGLSAILIFIGGKMLMNEFLNVPTYLSLLVIGSIVLLLIGLSLRMPRKLIDLSCVRKRALP